MRRTFVILSLVATLFAGTIAFSGEKTIGVTLLSREHVFFNIIEEALVNKAKELGYETIVVDSNMDVNKQVDQIRVIRFFVS